MKSFRSFLLFSSLFFLTTKAIHLRKRQDGIQPKVVSLDLHHTYRRQKQKVHHKRQSQDGVVETDLINVKSLYTFEASLGTPPQKFDLNLDTGSSDLWVNAYDSRLCSSPMSECGGWGAFTANRSSTYNFMNSAFQISYVDGSGASGDYATDAFKFKGRSGTITLDDLQFGIGYNSTSTVGVLGLGFPQDQVQADRDGTEPYENLPMRLVSEGIIPSRAFSLYLNDINAKQGKILFGGVDRAKYEGELVTLPIEQLDGEYKKFVVTLTGIDFESKGIREDMALGVLLDSGASVTYLPDDIAQDIINELGDVSVDEKSGMVSLPCSMADDDRNITFKFSSPAAIRVPMSHLVVNFAGKYQSRGKNQEQTCTFGIALARGKSIVLGDTFLRSAYVVFDMDNYEISMAQSKNNVTRADVVEIGVGEDAVPSTTDADAPVAMRSGYPGAGVALSPLRTETMLGCLCLLVGFMGHLL